MTVTHYKDKRKRRHLGVRSKVKGIAERPRLSIFRSSKHIYVQLINDEKGRTLVSASDVEATENTEKYAENAEGSQRLKGKTRAAYEVGKIIAEKALKKGVKKVVFDRGGYRYHGRVKALAEGAREGGLEF